MKHDVRVSDLLHSEWCECDERNANNAWTWLLGLGVRLGVMEFEMGGSKGLEVN